AGQFKTNIAAGLGIPSSLCADLSLAVDLLVVRCGEDAQAVGSSNRGGVCRNRVADGSGVTVNSGLLHIIASLGTNKETLMTQHGVDVRSRTLKEIEEGTGV